MSSIISETILVGGGGHGRVLADIVRRDGTFTLLGYVDREDRGEVDGLSWLGNDDVVPDYRDHCHLLYGLGLVANAKARWALFQGFREQGGSFANVVSRRATVSDRAVLGDGTVVFDLAAVNTGAGLGAACIVNTGAVVEHDCRLGDNVHVAPGAVLCGEVTVGAHCLVGAGATVAPGVAIAAGTVIGAGATVVADVTEPGTWVGVPARRSGEGMAL